MNAFRVTVSHPWKSTVSLTPSFSYFFNLTRLSLLFLSLKVLCWFEIALSWTLPNSAPPVISSVHQYAWDKWQKWQFTLLLQVTEMTCYRRNAKQNAPHQFSDCFIPPVLPHFISKQASKPARNNQMPIAGAALKWCQSCIYTWQVYIPFENLRQEHPVRSTAICQVRNDDSEEGVPTMMRSVIHTRPIPKLEAPRAWRTQRNPIKETANKTMSGPRTWMKNEDHVFATI